VSYNLAATVMGFIQKNTGKGFSKALRPAVTAPAEVNSKSNDTAGSRGQGWAGLMLQKLMGGIFNLFRNDY